MRAGAPSDAGTPPPPSSPMALGERATAAACARVTAQLDHLPLTRLHALAVGLCALGFAFDLMEIALGSALSAIFSTTPWQLAAGDLALLLASVYIGACIGAPLMGWLADRHGRRRVMAVCLGVLTFTSLGAALSASAGQLTVARGLSGLALGAYPPLMMAYLADVLPPARRGLLVFMATALASLGAPLGIFLVRTFTPIMPVGLDGWRWGFLLGTAGAGVLALLIQSLLPESPRWLAAQGRAAEANAACQRLLASKPLPWISTALPKPEFGTAGALASSAAPQPGRRDSGRQHWLLVAALFFLCAWSTVAFPLLSGAVLAHKGMRLQDTLLTVGLSTFGPVIGTLLVAPVIDRLGRRFTLVLCSASMLLCGAVFLVADTAPVLIASSLLFGVAGSVYIPTLHLYGAELFNDRHRAAALASGWSFNRLGAAIGPLLLLPLLQNHGTVSMLAIMALALALGVWVLWLAPAGRQGRVLR